MPPLQPTDKIDRAIAINQKYKRLMGVTLGALVFLEITLLVALILALAATSEVTKLLGLGDRQIFVIFQQVVLILGIVTFIGAVLYLIRKTYESYREHEAYLQNALFAKTGIEPSVASPSTLEQRYQRWSLQRAYNKASANPSKNPLTESEYFTFLAASRNCGSLEDIETFLKSHQAPAWSAHLAMHGLITTSQLPLEPFGPGVCWGTCLHFATRYLNTPATPFREKITNTTQLTAPAEAVIWHALSRKIFYSLDLNETTTRQRNQMVFHDCVGITSLADEESYTTRGETVEAICALKTGMYEVLVPTDSGGHAILVIKDGTQTALFDPNYGSALLDNEPAAFKHLLSHYYTKAEAPPHPYCITPIGLNEPPASDDEVYNRATLH